MNEQRFFKFVDEFKRWCVLKMKVNEFCHFDSGNEDVMRLLRLQSVLVMILFAVSLAGCAGALRQRQSQSQLQPQPQISGKETTTSYRTKRRSTYRVRTNIRFRGVARTYLVHLPTGYNARQPVPMVVLLHGAFGTARSMERLSGFSQLADEKKFIAIYPNGIGVLGKLQHWNAGHCCAEAVKEDIDDVGFLTHVIEDACRRLAVDRQRIYMVGFSNGGMMAYRFAAEKGNLLAGFAPLAASAGGRPEMAKPEWSIPTPVKSLPVIAMHGLGDDTVPFEGGSCPAWGTKREYWSVMRSLEVWTKRDGCAGPPTKNDQRRGKVHVRTWQKCKGSNKVVLYALEGWPHQWPGPHFSDKLGRQDPLYDFDAARIIWDFFESSRR